MVDTALFPAIKEAVRRNEIGDGTPYELSYARKGNSGASFGAFQGDTHASDFARTTLTAVLQAASAGAIAVARILDLVSQPCPNGSPLSGADAALADSALSSPTGRPLVDAMDEQLAETVLDRLDKCIAAANARSFEIDADALLYMALWVNMTGAPTVLSRWLGGSTELGVPPATGGRVLREHIETYLNATKFFRENPRNFNHMRSSVEKGIPLLPPSAIA